MHHKPKIAVIGLKGLPAFGGAASVGEALINELKDQFDIYVYSLATHTSKKIASYGFNQIIFEESKVNGIATYKYYLKSLLHCLFAEKYDLIHLHHSESGFISPFLRIKYKLLVTFHGVFINKIDPKFNSLTNLFFRISERLNILFANKIISVSRSDSLICEKKYHREVEYIPNGITPYEGATVEKKFDFLFIAARIYEIKGLHLLLQALKEHKISGKLLVIGDLEQVLDYKKTIIELSKNLDVEFIPLLKEKSELFKFISMSKLFVFPSLFEAMSMTLLEVVSLKVPVLASDIDANKNIFNENQITYFKSDDYQDLAAKLVHCIKSESELKVKSENAYNILIENYTWEKIALKYAKIYRELIT